MGKGRCATDQAVLRNVIPVAEQGLQHAGWKDHLYRFSKPLQH